MVFCRGVLCCVEEVDIKGPSIESIIDIIRQESIVSYFQPIISIKNRRIIGFESLTRGIDPETGDIISPLTLFGVAHRKGICHQLDSLCREKAVETFLGGRFESDFLLFMNFDPAILDSVMGNQHTFESICPGNTIPPSRIAIEIVESKVHDLDSLVSFVDEYRNRGYTIVLDDFGASHSNLDRICKLKPDIIKIDRKLVNGVSKDFYKQSIIGSVLDLANKIGTLTLVEGVEIIEDIVTCYELGVDLFQGFYFGFPEPPDEHSSTQCLEKIYTAADTIAEHLVRSLSSRLQIQKRFDTIIKKVLDLLTCVDASLFNECLKRIVHEHETVECAYILDENGVQVSDTMCYRTDCPAVNHPLFSPAKKGADHSLKNYYYYLKSLRLQRFNTDPYISLATGSVCRTLSETFRTESGERFILCIDFTT